MSAAQQQGISQRSRELARKHLHKVFNRSPPEEDVTQEKKAPFTVTTTFSGDWNAACIPTHRSASVPVRTHSGSPFPSGPLYHPDALSSGPPRTASESHIIPSHPPSPTPPSTKLDALDRVTRGTHMRDMYEVAVDQRLAEETRQLSLDRRSQHIRRSTEMDNTATPLNRSQYSTLSRPSTAPSEFSVTLKERERWKRDRVYKQTLSEAAVYYKGVRNGALQDDAELLCHVPRAPETFLSGVPTATQIYAAQEVARVTSPPKERLWSDGMTLHPPSPRSQSLSHRDTSSSEFRHGTPRVGHPLSHHHHHLHSSVMGPMTHSLPSMSSTRGVGHSVGHPSYLPKHASGSSSHHQHTHGSSQARTVPSSGTSHVRDWRDVLRKGEAHDTPYGTTHVNGNTTRPRTRHRDAKGSTMEYLEGEYTPGASQEVYDRSLDRLVDKVVDKVLAM
eukprot:m.118577 g.118577  ORF g.118577 m.118577 type:complete len:447 (+) comp17214_c0_seq2:279-1619(+)